MFLTRFTGVAALICVLAFNPSIANDDIHIDNVWSRPLPPVSANGAVYLQINNQGAEAVTVSGGSTPRAGSVELHEHIHQDGLMKMQQVDGGVQIGAGETISFEPGGLHVMLIGLTEPLVEGDHFWLTLEFSDASNRQVKVMITEKPPTGMSHGSGHDSH